MQPGCRCQKHPCTIMMARYRGNTISGLPGRSLRWSLKRNPSLWAIRRTTSSGLVSRPRIRDMISFRLARSKISLISQSVGRHPLRPAMSVKPAFDRSVIVAGSRTPTRREPLALVEDQPDLFDPWPLSGSSAVSDWESARQGSRPPVGQDLVGRLPGCVQLPMASRDLVGRVQNRVFVEPLHGGRPCRPRAFARLWWLLPNCAPLPQKIVAFLIATAARVVPGRAAEKSSHGAVANGNLLVGARPCLRRPRLRRSRRESACEAGGGTGCLLASMAS